MYRGGIVHRPALPESSSVIRQAAIEERSRTPESSHEGTDDVDILLVDLRFHVRRQVMPAHHQWPAHLEHARAARAVTDDAVQQVEVDARLFAHYHRFRRGQVVYGNQQVGHELEPGADAEFPAVVGRAREALENAPAALERAPRTARVD